jgi:hypothetical protein
VGDPARRYDGGGGSAEQRRVFKVSDADYEATVTVSRDAMDEKDFEAAWAEGAALSTEEAIAYAHRGRGERSAPPVAGPH